ncbi:replication-relaxation family protein [Dactylosporangium darangshiense]|uniref:replication-relaxation family protein n=1 Tax=Dactylosporangium darangshiense TaxID=579108 RepID=UPI00363BB0B5
MTVINSDRVLAARAFITDRDVCLLEWLHDHQVLTIEQITAALYDARKTATDRLLRLYRLGILERFQHTTPGRRTLYYVLGLLGAEIVAALRGDPTPRAAEVVARQRRIAMSPHLAHLRGVNQFFIDLIAHARHTPDAGVMRWWSERQCAEPLRFGSVSMHRVRADGHGIYAEGQRRIAFFLEYDRGTESVPLLLDKLKRYEQLTAQGGPAWPVLFFLPDRARERQLHQQRVVGSSPHRLRLPPVKRCAPSAVSLTASGCLSACRNGRTD